MDKKPSVFPTQEQRVNANQENDATKIARYEAEKKEVTNQIYTNSAPSDTPQGHFSAVEAMRERTANQLSMNENKEKIQYPHLAEKTSTQISDEQRNKRTEDQMKLRDEQLKKNSEQINQYQYRANEASARNNDNPETNTGLYNPNQSNVNNNYVPPSQPPVNNGYGDNYGQNPSNINPYIAELSQIDYNAPFDVIPLPSQGKLYRGKKPNVRIAYMTTADENILTSPNLLQSGEFLEILINRKLIEPELRYKDLNVGDRNAIMLWLRATAYGEMYPVTLLDEKDEPFDTQVNLNDLKTKNLGAEPDSEGLFDFILPVSKTKIKFKLLTCGDIEEIEKLVEEDKKNGNPLNKSNTYTFERIIVYVNGERNKTIVKNFANSLRINDGKKLTAYIEEIQSGIDLDIEIGTPGGGSIKTFLPLNINFFWPDIKL